MKTVCLIDADSLLYKGIEDFGAYQDRIDEIITQVVQDTKSSHYRVFLESPKNYTFRKILYPDYKSNRVNKELPANFKEIKQYIIETYNPYLSIGVETDDSVVATHRYLKENYPLTDVVLAVNDKDYKTFPVTIYDLYHGRFGDVSTVNKQDANTNFWIQMLMGDSSDGVKAIPNIGMVKAKKLLEFAYNPFIATYRQYYSVYGRKSREIFFKTYTLLKLKDDIKPCTNFDSAIFQ
jgi:hypothetical protein